MPDFFVLTLGVTLGRGRAAPPIGGIMTTTVEHRPAEAHAHTHGPDCGHRAVIHGDHVDYIHGGHAHREDNGHYDECDTCQCPDCSDSCAVCECADCTCPTCNHAVCS